MYAFTTTTNVLFKPLSRFIHHQSCFKMSLPAHTYSIAPMMDVTDRHFRALCRLITRHSTLYTEMVVDNTLIHNPKLRQYSLRIPTKPNQQPLVLQLGGSDPQTLSQAARYVSEAGYNEININCGCPSPKVAGRGCFGAALMRTPMLVAQAAKQISQVLPKSSIVTVKCRIGVDDDDSYQSLCNFIQTVHQHGNVNHFIIHARKAILGGLSPAQNRSIPPLKYHYVHQLLQDFPHLTFSINGGFKSIEDIKQQLEKGVHGVMVGRAVMDRPWHALCDVDSLIYNSPALDDIGNPITRAYVLQKYIEYAENEIEETDCSIRAVVKPLLNLFAGEKNGKRFRRFIDEGLRDKNLNVRQLIENAALQIPRQVLMAVPSSMQEQSTEVITTSSNIMQDTALRSQPCQTVPNVCT